MHDIMHTYVQNLLILSWDGPQRTEMSEEDTPSHSIAIVNKTRTLEQFSVINSLFPQDGTILRLSNATSKHVN